MTTSSHSLPFTSPNAYPINTLITLHPSLSIHSHPSYPLSLSFQGPDEAKVVIATNAAESSLTLPDCDHVICLGAHKMLSYSDRHNAAQLVNCWVSKASATQRAGDQKLMMMMMMMMMIMMMIMMMMMMMMMMSYR